MVAPVHPPESMTDARVVKEPTSIVDRRMSQRKGKVVTEVLVQWKNEGPNEDSWEVWPKFQARFPEFTKGLADFNGEGMIRLFKFLSSLYWGL